LTIAILLCYWQRGGFTSPEKSGGWLGRLPPLAATCGASSGLTVVQRPLSVRLALGCQWVYRVHIVAAARGGKISGMFGNGWDALKSQGI